MSNRGQLEIIRPGGEITFYSLDTARGVTNIGRHPDNDVKLDGPGVADHHAVLDHRNKPYNIVILGEEGTTSLAGKPLTPNKPVEMHDWNTLKIGSHLVVLLERTEGDVPIAKEPLPTQPVRKDSPLAHESGRPHDEIDTYIRVELDSRECDVTVEQQAQYELSITNGGDLTAEFIVTVEGGRHSWVSSTPPSLSLNEGEDKRVRVGITPPRHPSSRAGIHHVAIVVKSRQYPGHSSRIYATMTIAPYYDFSVDELDPKQQTIGAITWKGFVRWGRSLLGKLFRKLATTDKRGRSGKTRVKVTNKGNSKVAFHLVARDDANACSFEFEVPGETASLAQEIETELVSDKSVHVPIYITPLFPPFVGLRKQSHPFTVTVAALAQEARLMPRSLIGQVHVRPRIGSGLLLTLAVLFVVLVVVPVILFARPRVEWFSADSESINSGDTVMLRWGVAGFSPRLRIEETRYDASEAIIYPLNSEDRQRQMEPDGDATYTIVAENVVSDIFGFISRGERSVEIKVESLARIVSFSINDGDLLDWGHEDDVLLSWEVEGEFDKIVFNSPKLGTVSVYSATGIYTAPVDAFYDLTIYSGERMIGPERVTAEFQNPPPSIESFTAEDRDDVVEIEVESANDDGNDIIIYEVAYGTSVQIEWSVQHAPDIYLYKTVSHFPEIALGRRRPDKPNYPTKPISKTTQYRLEASGVLSGVVESRYIKFVIKSQGASPPPYDVTSSSSFTDSLTLSWKYDLTRGGHDPNDTYFPIGFRIYRAPAPYTDFSSVADTDALNENMREWTDDSDILCEHVYYVVAVYEEYVGDNTDAVVTETHPSEHYKSWPCPPSDLDSAVDSQTRIDLSWQDHSSDESNFYIESSSDGITDWETKGVTRTNSTNYAVTGLDCGTRYYYRVRAYRASDSQHSPYSKQTFAATQPCSPKTPINLIAEADPQGQNILLRWIDESSDESEFRIERRAAETNTSWMQIATVDADVTSYPNTDFECGLTYYYRVRAYRDSDHQYSDYSGDVLVIALCPPVTPSNLNATVDSQTQITLRWAHDSPDEQTFRIQRSLDGKTGWTRIDNRPVNDTIYADTELTCNTTYHYRVRAYRDSNTQYSKYSNVVSDTTQACPPPKPINLNATAVSQTQIDLVWQSESLDGLTFYIERSLDNTTWTKINDVGVSDTNYADTVDRCGISYYYRVRASRVGDGQHSDYSDSSSTIPPCPPPAAPSNLSATAVSQMQIDLKWQNNSPDATIFHIEFLPEGGTSWTPIGTVGGAYDYYSSSGLDCNTTYDYRVRAHRDSDNQHSDYSNVVSATTQDCPPPPPNTLVATSVGQMQISLTWQDGSSGKTAFHVERSPDGNSNWKELGSVEAGVTDFLDTVENCDTPYYYRVRARAGDDQYSVFSNVASVTPQCSSLAAPTNLSAITVSSTQIDLTWQDNSSDGSAFHIERSQDELVWTEIAIVESGIESYSDATLICNTTYYYRVRAVRASDGRYSGYSNVDSATTSMCP